MFIMGTNPFKSKFTVAFFVPSDAVSLGLTLPSGSWLAGGTAADNKHDVGGSGAVANTYYNDALLEFIGASYTSPTSYAVIVFINDDPTIPWYLNTDALCPLGSYD